MSALKTQGNASGTGTHTLQSANTNSNRTATLPDADATLGFLNVPISSTTTTIATSDVGKVISLSAGITIPNSTFAAGDVVSLYNNTSGNLTITTLNQIATAYIAGANTNRGGASGSNLTLATRGVATVLFISATECVITGNVS
jgi:hypothetical protein